MSAISTKLDLPKGFHDLEDFDPTILQEIRYAGDYNFIGRPLAGYEAQRCIVSSVVGKALRKVQLEAKQFNLTLKVYEAYRPLRACEDILKWSVDSKDQLMKEEFYKHIDKASVFDLSFVLLRSSHARGAAVDVTLVPLPVPKQKDYKKGDRLIDGILPKSQHLYDNSIDMGTGFDCFHEYSHTEHHRIVGKAKENRRLLCQLMHKQGFKNYDGEWWHFTFIKEPFPHVYFDFIISQRVQLMKDSN